MNHARAERIRSIMDELNEIIEEEETHRASLTDTSAAETSQEVIDSLEEAVQALESASHEENLSGLDDDDEDTDDE